ncbi:cobyrinic acid ac-diamide synthase [Acetobacter estunensis NRIC 0472]|nr:cobyrinic acid ac-diamide synthase [Acetobacter estunensis NRIC 0472]
MKEDSMNKATFPSVPRPYTRALMQRHQVPIPLTTASVPKQASTPHVVAIASGKGGVGKTWFSITLAHALASNDTQQRILIVDCDFGLGNVDVQLGLHHKYDLTHVLRREIPIEEAIVPVKLHNDGAHSTNRIDVLPGHSGSSTLRLLQPDSLRSLLEQIRDLGDYDVILLDLCAGIDWSSRMIAAAADTLLVVTTEEPTALTDAYAVLKLAVRDRRQDGYTTPNAWVVINQASGSRSGQATFDILNQSCKRFLSFSPHLAGVVRKDRRVSEMIRRQSSFLGTLPTSNTATDVLRVARQLVADTFPALVN